jgi:DNA-directed RNA polymerase subunit RPC12/RpoP
MTKYNYECSNCGMEIVIDNEKPLVICEKCGTKVLTRIAGENIDSYKPTKEEKLLKNAWDKFQKGNYFNAQYKYREILEINNKNWEAMFYRDISNLMLNGGNYEFRIKPWGSKYPDIIKAINLNIKTESVDDYFEYIKEKANNDLIYLMELQEKLWDLSKYTKFEEGAEYKYFFSFYLCGEGYQLISSLTKDETKKALIYKKLIFIFGTILNHLSEPHDKDIKENLMKYIKTTCPNDVYKSLCEI